MDERLAERLHMARWRSRVSLRELGRLTGFSASTLHRIERGKPSASVAKLLVLLAWVERETEEVSDGA